MPWSAPEVRVFADRVRAAREAALEHRPHSGTTGLELEWNLLDSRFQPLQVVGAGTHRRSFADIFRDDFLPPWLSDRTQLEVFHWMIEWTTRPQPSPWLAVAEARILEACQANALHQAGLRFGEPLTAWHGNLLTDVKVGPDSIPGGWNLAKRRYLERCVDLYGARLATAGNHVNLTLPEPLLAWDFMHRRSSRRSDHLDDFKSRIYIDLTRRIRPFAALFIATSAGTPFRAGTRSGRPVVRLSPHDSVRSLTFPNPAEIDLPGLYRSHADYIRLSYELVRRGVRFGNNNWTPVRARSFAEPVERLISLSAEQLEALYRKGLYAGGTDQSLEQMAQRVVEQNLFARIDLPMARLELRTDEGGHPFDLDVANLALRELLLLRLYADRSFGRPVGDDAPAIDRFRRNERAAARRGMRAEIEDPSAGSLLPMRRFLRQALVAVWPLAEALGYDVWLKPLEALAEGAPNTAERLRAEVRRTLGRSSEVPDEFLLGLSRRRTADVAADIEQIASVLPTLGSEADTVRDLWDRARDWAHRLPGAPVRFRPTADAVIEIAYASKTDEILDLAQRLIRIPSVSGAPPTRQRPDAIRRTATLLIDTLRMSGLKVDEFDSGRFPALLARFPGSPAPPVLLAGHFDVVEPEPDDSQFEPRLDGDYLWGRGAADMKTVVATFAVWMKDLQRSGGAPPPIGLLLVGNEEIGENEPDGTPHVLAALRAQEGYEPEMLVAGERTGEEGDEILGAVCLENRGLVRLEVELRSSRRHTGLGEAGGLDGSMLRLRSDLEELLRRSLARPGADRWSSQFSFPFQRLGEEGLFNISPERAVLGIEIRPIPEHRVEPLIRAMETVCAAHHAALSLMAREDGVACDPDDPYVAALLQAIHAATGDRPAIQRKLAATSARFAPGGRGVVWGQSGVGPHAADERHFIPSIEPYYRSLVAFAETLRRVVPDRARPSGRPRAGKPDEVPPLYP